MAKPWERYQDASGGGKPWEKYGADIAIDEQPDAEPGYGGRLREAWSSGVDNTGRALRGAQWALGGDADVDDLARSISGAMQAGQNRDRTPGQERLDAAIEDVGKAEGTWDTLGAIGSAVGTAITEPGAVGLGVAENLPYTVPSLLSGAGGAVTGAATGAGIGAVAGGAGAAPGAVTGALWGGRAGMVAGTTATELGAEMEQMIQERLEESGQPATFESVRGILADPEFKNEVRLRGGAKGLTLAAVDQLTMGLAGRVMRGPTAAAERAAQKSGSALVAPTAGQRIGAAAGAGTIGLLGEPAGEAASQAVARGEIDMADVTAEGIYGAGQAVGHAAIGRGMAGAQAAARRMRDGGEGRVSDADSIEGRYGDVSRERAAEGEIIGNELPTADTIEPGDVTHNGKPFITRSAAERAAEEAGDDAQVHMLGDRYIVRRSSPTADSWADLDRPAVTRRTQGDADGTGEVDVTQPTGESQQQVQAEPEYTPGQTVYVSQDGRSMPVEFVGYESNVATTRPGGTRIARIRTADGRGHFVNVSDLVSEAPPSPAALPAAENVSAAGDGFVTRPTFNTPQDAPRGIRNNNPGNIERGVGFQGEVDGNDTRFATFDSPESGVRALARNLLTYQERHGLNNVKGIINRWAPDSENETGAYVNAVSQAMGVRPGDSLNLRDPAVLERLTTAIIHHENGMQPYPAQIIQAGVASAMTGAPSRAALPAPQVTVDSEGVARTADQRTLEQQNQQSETERRAQLGMTPDVEAAARQHPGSLEAAFHEAATSPNSTLPEPTQAQKEAGNYKKGHVNLDGLDISIENPEGSVRSGVDPDGNEWSNTMQSHYGYIRRTTGADGEHVDTFVRPGTETIAQTPVFAIDQVDPSTGRFDETKLMLGYGSQAEAEAAYRANYAPDWQGMGTVTQWDLPTLKRWFQEGDTTQPASRWASAPDSGLDSIDGQDVSPPGSAPGTSPVSSVVTPAGREIDVRYRVVDADQLVTSNTEDGRVNPRYPQSLQPRDRSRGTSQLQINDMAANIRPALLGSSPTTSDGAPIVSRAGIVESGNGRTLALQRAYREGRGDGYRSWLQEQGYDTAGMRAPVLVRQRETDLSDADLQAYTRESNERTTLQMSAAEQAQADAQSINPILGDYQGGDISSAANREFVRKFTRDVASASDRGSMVDAEGALSQQGKRRIEAALLSAAYGSPDLVTDLYESADNDIKSIGGALLDVAGPWAQMRQAVEQGAIPSDMDLTENLVGAVNLVRRARAEGRSINELANQVDIISGEIDPTTQEFLRLFFSGEQLNRARGRRPMADSLSEYVRIAQSTVPGENMFGDSPPTGDEVLRTVHGRQRNSEQSGQQQDLYASAPGSPTSDEAQRGQARGQRDAGLREPTPERGERSAGVVNERDPQTIDMFSGQGQAQGNLELSADRAQTAPARRRSAPRVPSFPSADAQTSAVVVGPAKNGKSAVIVESQQVATIAVGPEAISTPADAAHALASLRKHPQENLVALLTDADGQPISVLRHTIGRTASADVMPSILAGHTARFPNAAHVWLAHNHPSGVAEFSDADRSMTGHYAKLVSGSDIALQGMLAIGGGNYAFMDPSGRQAEQANAPIPPRARTRSVEVVERRFRRQGTLSDRLQPDTAGRVINDILDGEPGIVFLDAKLRPVASLPMSVSAMSRLKGTGGVDRVLAGLERANASATVVNVPDDSAASLNAARNVGTLMGMSGDIQPIDIVAGMKSMAARGEALRQTRNVVESRDPLMALYRSSVPVSKLRSRVKQITDKMPGASGVEVRVVANRLDVQDAEGHLPSMGAEGIYFPSARNADGDVQPGRIYLMADALGSMERAEQVLAHELVGHFGLEAMLGENFSAVLDDVVRLGTVPLGVEIGRQRPGDQHYATLDAVKQDYPDYSPANQAREVLARMAETGQRPYFLERVWSHIRRFLRSMGLAGRYTNAEIKTMVVDAAKQLRSMQGGQAAAGALNAAESLRAAESKRSPAAITDELLAMANENAKAPGPRKKIVYRTAAPQVVQAAQSAGLNVAGYNHIVDSSAVRHMLKQHTDVRREQARGNLPLTQDDIAAIPSLLDSPDKLMFGQKNNIGRDVVMYLKRLPDGTALYLEEVRTGRKELAAQTMRKYPATTPDSSIIAALRHTRSKPTSQGELIVVEPEGSGNADAVSESRSYVEVSRSDGKPWRMRSAAQKVADEVGGSVQPYGDGFIVRRDVVPDQRQRPSDAEARTSQTTNQAPPREGLSTSGSDQTQTPAFRKWFGNSKVVDTDGQPLVVYHGTDQSFDVFEGESWFTDSASDASTYSNIQTPDRERTPNVMPAYLSIKKPKVIDTYATRSDIADAKATGRYDGVIIRRVGGGDTDNYVTFRPEQVKSAIGNRGTFDGQNPSVLESRATTADPTPAQPERAPRHRGSVARPGENLNNLERELRQRTLEKMGAFSKIEPIQDRARTYTERWREKAIQGVFDQFAPLRNLNPVAYMQARLSKGTDGAVEAVFMLGKAKLSDGALDVDSSGGLVDVLAQLGGEHDHFLAWIAGNRAKRLKAEGRENLFTEQDIEILTDLNKGRMADGRSRSELYAKALKEFNGLQQSVLDVAQDAGLINRDSRDLWEHEFYVPFYRVMEEDGTGTMGPGQIGGLVGQRAFKQLKGGQEKLGDLLSNTLSNWSHLLSASMKNMAAQKALESAQEIGIAQRVKAAEKGSVRIMNKGKEQHYLVDDPLVMDALTSLHYVGPNTPVMNAMRKFKHYLTVGVTTSPTFRIRNLARDVISAMATTDVSYNPLKNMADGWRGTSSTSPTYQKLLAGGGAIRFGLINDGDQAHNARRLINRGVEADQILDSQTKVRRLFRSAWDAYQETGDRAETINRAAIYEKAIKAGKSHLEASYEARDLMDFTAGGKFASIRLLTQVIPFFNARLQGMYKLGRAAKDDPRRFAVVTGAVALASALSYLHGHDDEEYQALPDWVRNTYWAIRVPGVNKMVYIPKPFEVGALGTVVERLTELAVAGDDYQAKDFAQTLLSVTSDQLAMNPVPQLFKPAMYAAFNRDDFRGTNLDSQAQLRLPAQDRYTARTSAGAVLAGRALNQSPQRIEYMLRSYFGWLGTQALNVADFAARPFTDMPENPARDMSRVDNWFVMGDFLKESQVRSSKYIQRFYDTQREIEQIYAGYSEARRLGDIERAMELAGDDKIKLRPIYQAANKQMQSINRRIKQVDNDPSMDAAQKSQQREYLYQQRNRIAMMADQQARAR